MMEHSYKIIGGDGREYGPATIDELIAWIRDGRISRATLVWRDDSRVWSAASTYAELHPQFGPSAETAPADPFPRVGFWPRFGAYILDRIVLQIAFSVVWLGLSRVTGWETPDPATPANLGEWLQNARDLMPLLTLQLAFYLPMHILYDVLLIGKFGATPGKMAIGARIVRLDGSAVGFRLAFGRWLAARVSDLTCYLGYLLVAFRGDKRGLHDLIAGTQVIYKR